jgi:4-amino-4-deoxy-L-arabinose transferase-like glycosyltransferase
MAVAVKPRDERSESRGLRLPAGFTSFIPRLGPSITRDVVLLLAFAAALFLPFLGNRELSSSHEARAAINATVVLERGTWGLPRLFDEQIELQKPPLYYWLVSLLGMWRGQVDAWAVRLPATLGGIGCVLCVYWFLARQGRSAAGLLAALMLATMVHFTWLAQVGRVDMVLTLLVTVGLCCEARFQRALRHEKEARDGHVGNVPHVIACLALGLGALCKGPIALALAGAVGVTWLVLTRQAPSRRWMWGTFVIAAVSLPWFVWANHETGGRLFDVFFWHHNIERGFGSETLQAQPWWFYGMRFWIDLAPWSFAAPFAVVWAWRRGLLRDDSLCRFGLAWFGSMFVLLSCAGFKRADYLLPAYPGLAVFLGAAAADWLSVQSERVRGRTTPALVAIAFLAGAGWWTFHLVADEAHPYRDAAARIRRGAGPDTPVIFFRAECHPLVFHLGRPMTTVLEWENAEIWARKPRPIWLVMPASCAAAWNDHNVMPLQAMFALEELPSAESARALVVLRNAVVDP